METTMNRGLAAICAIHDMKEEGCDITIFNVMTGTC